MMGHYTAYLKTVREPPRAARFQVSTSHSMSTTHIKPPLDNPEDMFDSMSPMLVSGLIDVPPTVGMPLFGVRARHCNCISGNSSY